GIERGIRRGFAVPDDLRAQYPNLEMRANRYLPVLDRALKAALTVIAVLAVLQVWGLGGFEWLATDSGRRVLSGVISIALVLAIAAVVWELVNGAIERRLARVDSLGTPVQQRAR